jgi:hypothetical protein
VLKPDELPSDVRAFLTTSRRIPPRSPEDLDRGITRLEVGLAAIAAPPAGLSRWPAPRGLATLVLGGLLGAGGLYGSQRIAERAAAVPAAASVPSTGAVAPVAGPSARRSAASTDPSRARPPGPVSSAPTPATSGVQPRRARRDAVDRVLAADRAVLERVRSALLRRDPDGALATLVAQERRLARGPLGEESAFLRIQALAAAGRDGEARERAVRFRMDFPASVFSDALDRALSRDRRTLKGPHP